MAVATFVFHKGPLLRNGMTTFTLLLSCVAILLLGADRLSLDISKQRNKHIQHVLVAKSTPKRAELPVAEDCRNR
jgi:hypothetical protein